MAGLYLVPDERVVIQAAIYLVGLAAAHHFLVRPLVLLNSERRLRTVGSTSKAEVEQSRISSLDDDYRQKMAAATAQAKELRHKELLAGEGEAEEIIRSANQRAKAELDRVRLEVDGQLNLEREGLKTKANEVAKTIVDRLVSLAWVVFGVGAVFVAPEAHAAGGSEVDFWYSIFWPYFQFAVFIFGFWYFGRKPFASMLQKKRDALRTQLSEARQATHVAEAKVKEFELKVASLESDLENLRRQHATEGARQRESLISEAKSTRDQIMRDTEKRATELIHSARESLRRELVDETLKAVQEQLDPARLAVVSTKARSQALSLVKNLKDA
jgi:F0F1-type ATP synthase membrane subunit b/b'